MIGVESWVRSGNWVVKGFYLLKNWVYGKCVGVFGFGCIGYEVVKWFVGFDMDIVYMDVLEWDFVRDWIFVEDVVLLVVCFDFFFVIFVVLVVMCYIVGK